MQGIRILYLHLLYHRVSVYRACGSEVDFREELGANWVRSEIMKVGLSWRKICIQIGYWEELGN